MNEVPIPELRVGEPTRCGTLAVFPLYAERTLFPDRTFDYQLSDEAQQAGTCLVREVSPEGKVGELVIENTGTLPVLYVEGEELNGGKQCRVVRASVLIAAGSTVVVPVFCTEVGRWDKTMANLKTGSHSPPSLHRLLKQSSGFHRHFADQLSVWRFVAAAHFATETLSPKGNLSDVLTAHAEVAKQLRQDLRYPDGACGIAVAVRGGIVGIDLFDRPDSLNGLWDRLVIMGLTLDAVDLRDADLQADDISGPVKLYMEKVRDMRWRPVEQVVGLGETYRATGNDGSLATALVVEGKPIHLSIAVQS